MSSPAEEPRCDLVLWSEESASVPDVSWDSGRIVRAIPNPRAGSLAVDEILSANPPEAILFWDARLPLPSSELITGLLNQPYDLWHAGLHLGAGGKPEVLDMLSPGWMYSCDPEVDKRAVSWRVSLAGCLARSRVLSALGHIDPEFETLAGAGLEFGYRIIWRGAVPVHEPSLHPDASALPLTVPSFRDEYLFVARHFQRFWLQYVLARRILKFKKWRSHVHAWRAVSNADRFPMPDETCLSPRRVSSNVKVSPEISVLIPTLCRYPYLEDTLNQLRAQTVRPLEVVCVDQTPHEERQPEMYARFSDLNLRVIWMEEPGQCSARNAGLEVLQGNAVLFLDDDVMIPDNYIEALRDAITLEGVDSAQGVWSQGESQAVARVDRQYRLSDRFATGNSLTWMQVVRKVGGFDLNYNRNYRADADLGMRLYRSGAILLITPHALENSLSPPTGGLKYFGALAGFGNIGLFKPWPAVTQTYYWLRYFSRRQVREALWLTLIAATIPVDARYSSSSRDKVFFVFQSLWKLPFRLVGMARSIMAARALLRRGPKIAPIGRGH